MSALAIIAVAALLVLLLVAAVAWLRHDPEADAQHRREAE